MSILSYLPLYCRRVVSNVSVLMILSAIALCPSLGAQTDIDSIHITPSQIPATSDKGGPTRVSADYKSTADIVFVPVTITDPMNRPVLGLNKQNFNVYENKQLQSISHFSTEDSPISVGVLFDTSGSMSSKLERASQAAMEFFKTANPQDEFCLIEFSDSVREVANFTDSVDDIHDKLTYTVPKGRTALLDAIYMGIAAMRHAKYSRKALLIISDGGDNHSRYTEGEVNRLVKESDVMIFAIGIYDHYFATEEERLGPELLDSVAQVTGGASYTIDNPKDLMDTAVKIGTELRNQYVLEYRPLHHPRDGKWHKLKVSLSLPKGFPHLHIAARQGYYASTE